MIAERPTDKILERGITIEIDGNYIYGDSLEKLKISEAIDPIGSEIQIGTCDFILKRYPEFENLFSYGKFFKVYFDGKIKTVVRVYSANVVDEKRLEIQAEDLFGVLEDEFYYGNIAYPTVDATIDNRPNAGDVLREIFDTANVRYQISPELEDVKLYGELFKVTCREALMQVCFAIGAMAFCSGQDFITVKKPDNSVKQIIDRKRIKEGTRFTTNIMTKYVAMSINYDRLWDDETNIDTIFKFSDTLDVKAGEIREYTHEQPMGDYQMKSLNLSQNVVNIQEGKYFKFLEKKPNKVIVQFLEVYMYEPTNVSYFDFDLNDETMTATVNLTRSNNLLDINFPYSVNVDDKWYEVVAIGDCSALNGEKVKIPPTITTIKENAFKNLSISAIFIPGSVIQIKDNSFSGTKISTIRYGGNKKEWNNISWGAGNESVKNNEYINFNWEDSQFDKRRFGLEGFGYGATRRKIETKINPNAINYPYSQEASMSHSTLVTYDYGKDGEHKIKIGNLSEVLERVYNELTKTEQIECVIFEGRSVQEGDFVRYGQDKYGSVVYGSQRKSEITYDKPINIGDVVGIEVNEYGYREKRIISQEYELNGNIIAKKCILR